MSDPVDAGLGAVLDDWVQTHHDELVATRRHLHAHPELGFAEHETTAYLERQLRRAGLATRRLPGGTGLVSEIGSGGPVTVLRADIDALPRADLKQVPYASTREGMCHACGHDVHTTVLLGVVAWALVLAGQGLAGRHGSATAPDGRARSNSKPRAASPSKPCGPSPPPASNASRSARSPTRRPRWT